MNNSTDKVSIITLEPLPITRYTELLRRLYEAGRIYLSAYRGPTNNTGELFMGTARTRNRLKEMIAQAGRLGILERPTTHPVYLTAADFPNPTVIANLGAGDEHLEGLKGNEPNLQLILTTDEQYRIGSAISVAELTQTLGIMLSRGIRLGIGLTGDHPPSRFHNRYRPFLEACLLRGGHWFCWAAGQQVRYLLPLLRALGIWQVTVCTRRTLSGEEKIKLTALVPGVAQARTSDGSMWINYVDEKDRATELATADVISLHVPKVSSPKYDSAFFKSVKTSALVINTSRGANADEKAVVAALEAGLQGRRGGIAGYGTDVLYKAAEEQGDPELSPLWQYDREQAARPPAERANLIILPHIGGSTVDSFEDFGSDVIPRMLDALNVDWREWDN